MTEYKPKFNAKLPWTKVLELMNEMVEHKIESSGSCGEIKYIIVELNDETKEILNQLGIDINQVEDDFYDKEENWIDITSIVWGNIAWHYGQELWYTGKKFIVYDEEKNELLKAARDMYRILVGTGYNAKIPDDLLLTIGGYKQKLKSWGELLERLEGDAE